MLPQMISEAIPNVISLQASASGHMHYVQQDGLIADQCGQEAALASLSPKQAKEKHLMTSGTYGRLGTISLESANLQSSLVSRLRLRLPLDGLTSYKVIWKEKATPAGRLISVLRGSVLRTSGKGSTTFPTPAARDYKDLSRTTGFLSQTLRHSPSIATRLLSLGAPWQGISQVYCSVMGLPSQWND